MSSVEQELGEMRKQEAECGEKLGEVGRLQPLGIEVELKKKDMGYFEQDLADCYEQIGKLSKSKQTLTLQYQADLRQDQDSLKSSLSLIEEDLEKDHSERKRLEDRLYSIQISLNTLNARKLQLTQQDARKFELMKQIKDLETTLEKQRQEISYLEEQQDRVQSEVEEREERNRERMKEMEIEKGGVEKRWGAIEEVKN